MENEEVDMEYVKELLERNKTLPKETKKYLHKCEHCGQFLVPLLEFDICPYCDWQQNVDEDENEI